MNTTLKQQIEAIQVARKLLEDIGKTLPLLNSDLDARLNDAGSTIADLNLSPNSRLLDAVKQDSLNAYSYLLKHMPLVHRDTAAGQAMLASMRANLAHAYGYDDPQAAENMAKMLPDKF